MDAERQSSAAAGALNREPRETATATAVGCNDLILSMASHGMGRDGGCQEPVFFLTGKMVPDTLRSD